ncbi:MAG: hypothetical protein PVJ21_11965 [Anaerolineales bacterium]|jgi:hypothetical protein
MRKRTHWILIILAALMLSNCSPVPPPSAGIQITDVTVAVGRVEGSADQQVVSYKVTIQNNSQNDVIIHWIEPVLNEKISGRLIDGSPHTIVNKTLKANSSLKIDEQFKFDSSGITKEQITSWEPFFKEMLISTAMNLSLPSQPGN